MFVVNLKRVARQILALLGMLLIVYQMCIRDSVLGSRMRKTVPIHILEKAPGGILILLDVYKRQGEYWGNYTTRARARMLYKSPEGNEIWGRLWQVAKEHREAQGTAHKLECGVKIKSVEYGKLEGKGGYEQGTLTFPSYTSVGKYTSKLYGEIYGELEHILMPDDVDQVDILLAGSAKYAHRES